MATVYCSYCHEKGHNKLGCEKRKEHIENLRKEHPDAHAVKAYDRVKRRSKVRTCRYCREEGHNRKSCEALKSDMNASISECREWRQEALRALDDLGLGVGALVSTHGKIGLVVGFNWAAGSQAALRNDDDYWSTIKDSAVPLRLRRAFKPRLIDVKMVDTGRPARWEFPKHPLVSPHTRVEVVSPVAESFAKDAPEGWVDDEPPYDIMNYFNPRTWPR